MKAPDYKGDCNPLTRENNKAQGIMWAKGEVRVPFAFKNSQQIRAAGEEVLKGRQLYLADDMDGCAWDATDMMADVLHQADKDNNLLKLPPGEGRHTRTCTCILTLFTRMHMHARTHARTHTAAARTGHARIESTHHPPTLSTQARNAQCS